MYILKTNKLGSDYSTYKRIHYLLSFHKPLIYSAFPGHTSCVNWGLCASYCYCHTVTGRVSGERSHCSLQPRCPCPHGRHGTQRGASTNHSRTRHLPEDGHSPQHQNHRDTASDRRPWTPHTARAGSRGTWICIKLPKFESHSLRGRPEKELSLDAWGTLGPLWRLTSETEISKTSVEECNPRPHFPPPNICWLCFQS